ncbi:MAG: hypothetical protein NTX02_10970 [Planctomycetia bacterium]|nr:hypothetical protein [Planctomycetia bacterium]RLS31206.1 MAG: hypothetical protein DWH80_06925 [Planctomycetota bacterium]
MIRFQYIKIYSQYVSALFVVSAFSFSFITSTIVFGQSLEEEMLAAGKSVILRSDSNHEFIADAATEVDSEVERLVSNLSLLDLGRFERSGFGGSGVVGKHVRQAIQKDKEQEEFSFKMAVNGPPSRIPKELDRPSADSVQLSPLTAMLKSTFIGIDLSAGLVADKKVLLEGPARWSGAMKMSFDGEDLRKNFEMRTSLAQTTTSNLVDVEVGPRFERDFRGGFTFFVDGKAQARAVQDAESYRWSVPGNDSSGSTMLGVTGRTGFQY